VLSIGKLVAGSEDYYLNTVASGREEYYTGACEAPGQWLGSGTRELGLSSEVVPRPPALRARWFCPRWPVIDRRAGSPR
jgi:hypothetical protein